MDRPERTPPPSLRSLLPVALALVAAAFICVVLFFLTLGLFAVMMAIGAVVFGFTAFHYLVWGWWIGPALRREAEEEERKP